MCGINGIISPSEDRYKLKRSISRMNTCIAHRGPDGDGDFLGNGFALGHRRLAIIDITRGKQPMVDDRGYAITFNGEIYNFREIRDELKSHGEKFYTDSDTEVLLKAYIFYGKECLTKLNGIFAFAIVHIESGELFFARDRIGVKPLYYSVFLDGIVFSSEIKAILACDFVCRDIDLSLIPFYLSTGFYPREFTPFKTIRQLRPGHWARFRNKRMNFGCYWDVHSIFKNTNVHRMTEEDKEEFVQLIEDSIKLQTVSDVPIGSFLSGGIDSGIVTSILGKFMPTSFKTFTVGISDSPDMDERFLASQVAKRYNTDHNELQVSYNDILTELEKLSSHFDQPFADLSMLPTYLISKFSRKSVKVILSGDGGDEQWGGYENYRRYWQIICLKHLLGENLSFYFSKAAPFFSFSIRPFSNTYAERIDRYGQLFRNENKFLYRNLSSLVPHNFLFDLCGERVKSAFDVDIFESLISRDANYGLDGIMVHDVGQYMVDDVLRKVDMMSMAVGLEVRVPLLDHRIVEKSVSISWADKINSSNTKTIIRRIFNNSLPVSVLKGKKKGFSIPVNNWLRGPLREMAHSILFSKDSRQRNVISHNKFLSIWNEFYSGRSRNGKLIFALIILENWLKKYDH